MATVNQLSAGIAWEKPADLSSKDVLKRLSPSGGNCPSVSSTSKSDLILPSLAISIEITVDRAKWHVQASSRFARIVAGQR